MGNQKTTNTKKIRGRVAKSLQICRVDSLGLYKDPEKPRAVKTMKFVDFRGITTNFIKARLMIAMLNDQVEKAIKGFDGAESGTGETDIEMAAVSIQTWMTKSLDKNSERYIKMTLSDDSSKILDWQQTTDKAYLLERTLEVMMKKGIDTLPTRKLTNRQKFDHIETVVQKWMDILASNSKRYVEQILEEFSIYDRLFYDGFFVDDPELEK